MHAEGAERLATALGIAAPADDAPQAPDPGALLTALVDAGGALRRENQTTVVAQALNMLQGGLAPGDMDRSWLLAFLDLAAVAVDGRTRTLAARLLAHQLLRPGFIARASLAVAARLDGAALDLAERLATLACGDFVIRLPGTFLEQRGLSQTQIDQGEELGLLLPSEGRSKLFGSQVEDRFVNHLPYRDRLLRIEHETAERQLAIPVIRLTRAGADLAAVLRVEEDLDYLMRATAFIRRMGFRVTQSTIAGRDVDPNVVRHNGFTEIVPLASAWE